MAQKKKQKLKIRINVLFLMSICIEQLFGQEDSQQNLENTVKKKVCLYDCETERIILAIAVGASFLLIIFGICCCVRYQNYKIYNKARQEIGLFSLKQKEREVQILQLQGMRLVGCEEIFQNLKNILKQKNFKLCFFLQQLNIDSIVQNVDSFEELGNKMFFKMKGTDKENFGDWEAEAVIQFIFNDKITFNFLKKYKTIKMKGRKGEFSILIYKGQLSQQNYLVLGSWHLINFEYDQDYSGTWALKYNQEKEDFEQENQLQTLIDLEKSKFIYKQQYHYFQIISSQQQISGDQLPNQSNQNVQMHYGGLH